jgi:hypothetical protein
MGTAVAALFALLVLDGVCEKALFTLSHAKVAWPGAWIRALSAESRETMRRALCRTKRRRAWQANPDRNHLWRNTHVGPKKNQQAFRPSLDVLCDRNDPQGGQTTP